jgi:ribonuclease E
MCSVEKGRERRGAFP